jgi:YidC/Oxa1 family membrane protein insertase
MWDSLIINPFVNVLLWINQTVGSFGIAIILFTILIRLITYPLTVQQIKGTTAMQDLQKDKRYLEMQVKYKNDKEKLAQEQMALYKELGVNPLASCLPTLIQFPIIIGLYQALIKALATSPLDLLLLSRHIYPSFLNFAKILPLNSTFLWMDLSQPERLELGFLPFGIPILAIIVVVTTYMQSKLMTPPPSGNPNDQSAMMGNMMNLYMPFLMGWLALTMASGLALYFVISNVAGILQYALMGKLNWKNLLPGKPAELTASKKK